MANIPPKGKGKFELLTGKITELKKKEKEYDGGGGGGVEPECIIIERASNGYILRMMAAAQDEEGMIEVTFVLGDKDELFKMLKDHI